MEQSRFTRLVDRLSAVRWFATGAVLVVAALLMLSGCAAQATSAPPTDTERGRQGDSDTGSSSGWDLSMQQNSAGRVDIDVTPLAMDGDAWEFEVALNTHSVDLGFDLTEVSALRCDQGQEFEAIAWDGSGPGGHHRSGVLKFAALDHATSSVELVIRDVAQVPERVFRWETPGEAKPSEDSVATQTSSTAADGPANVTLSDQTFDYGNVSMNGGVAEQAIDITNSGGDILRIQSVEPT